MHFCHVDIKLHKDKIKGFEPKSIRYFENKWFQRLCQNIVGLKRKSELKNDRVKVCCWLTLVPMKHINIIREKTIIQTNKCSTINSDYLLMHAARTSVKVILDLCTTWTCKTQTSRSKAPHWHHKNIGSISKCHITSTNMFPLFYDDNQQIKYQR